MNEILDLTGPLIQWSFLLREDNRGLPAGEGPAVVLSHQSGQVLLSRGELAPCKGYQGQPHQLGGASGFQHEPDVPGRIGASKKGEDR